MTLVTPITTEKAYGLSSSTNTYVFAVPLSANKQEIARAVEEQYEVSVANVRTLVQTGKSLRFSRGKNRYPGTTSRSNSKKAYVTLAGDSTIPVFDTTEQEAK